MSGPAPSAVLVDPALDEELSAEGFVIVDLLDADQVEGLRDAWRRTREVWTPVYDPVGLATTLRHPGIEDLADSLIGPVVAPQLARVLVDREPFISVFVVKSPHSAALPAHLDWQMVDDGAVLTHGCWTPLEDTAPERGALGVVPRSHLDVAFDRTPEDPGHEWSERYLADGAQAVVLDVRAGQVVIYDHRLIHFSPPNDADGERVAANCATAPRSERSAARRRLVGMMARGMAGAGGGPQIPGMTHG